MLEENSYYEVTVKEPHKGEEFKVKVWWEGSAFDWQVVFKNIMYWLTFAPETIKEIFSTDEDDLVENQDALVKIEEILAQPPDRISEVTLAGYLKIREKILNVIAKTRGE
jgi:hypothetical protein